MRRLKLMRTNGDDLSDLKVRLAVKEDILESKFLKTFNLVEHFTDRLKVPVAVLVILLFIVQIIFIISVIALGGAKYNILGGFTFSYQMNNFYLALSVEGLITLFFFLYSYTSLLHLQILGYRVRIANLSNTNK